MISIFRVVQQGEAFDVQSQKAEGGTTKKCNIVLQEFGGKYENQYVCVMLGVDATCKFSNGSLVVAALRFKANEHNGATYQDILVTDIAKLN
jgi:hypothetical protein